MTTIKLRLKWEPVSALDKTEEEIIPKELRANGKRNNTVGLFL